MKAMGKSRWMRYEESSDEKKGMAIFLVVVFIFGCLPQSISLGGASAEESGNSNGTYPGNTGFEPTYYYIGNVVNAANGNLFFSTKDISIRARGFDIEIVHPCSVKDTQQVY
nr:hypothetical protein GZ17C7_35 [uncultured archaeon GZfos17C7]AAU84073.1 hypothetical protein GZ36D8_29 [uncultured archaeon GZfos36D8]